MISNKKTVQYLHKFCKDLGLDTWVLSPGSRNAPITATFASDEDFHCHSVVDERSAAFIALGMSLASEKCIGLSCTSGSASLNYAPALSEAYYQKIPLLVVTADRPQKWIGNGEGQCINQVEVYRNFVVNSYHLDDDSTEKEIEVVLYSISLDLESRTPGPIHLNIAFDEPLYEKVVSSDIQKKWVKDPKNEKSVLSLNDYSSQWNSYKKVMILCGQMRPDEKLQYQLTELNADSRVVILTETLSNISDFAFINCIDRTLSLIDDSVEYQPDLVITLGDAIVSKKIKTYLRNCKNLIHWHVSECSDSADVFECLDKTFKSKSYHFCKKLIEINNFSQEGQFKNSWRKASFIAEEKHNFFVSEAQWSDLKVFEILHDTLPVGINLHMGNSSAIRYIQLFNAIEGVSHYGNRGVSGIDGSSSTAVGFSTVSRKMNVLISGDLSFVYDINAFWNSLEKRNLKIIVINNNGGGIFRIIPGPASTGHLETRFEVGNSASIESLCKAYGGSYFVAKNESELTLNLENLYAENDQLSILEIVTPSEINAVTLKTYFETLAQ